MSRSIDPDWLVPRTCTTFDEKSGVRERRALADFRDVPAYVLLGDPGAGKTESLKQEAEAVGGYYIRARSFAALDPSPELVGKTLFIDGLDEMRAGGGDGRTPLDYVRRHLDRLDRPRFRLSCREADWYGDSDRAALLEFVSEERLAVLHLDRLDERDVAQLLERKFGIDDPNTFVKHANRHGLADLLRNPQTLGLLANAVRDDAWPDSRRATYELACKQLVRENNCEHRDAKRSSAPAFDDLLNAASFLCAVQLLAGIAGFALDDGATDDQHASWRELAYPRELRLPEALASGVFQHDDLEQQRIPIHRSIAEFLGARYLTMLIETRGLSLGRVVALMTGEDGGIVQDLRGLAAWLAVHSRSARSELIGRDPLGVVLYGDVRGFPLDDKRRVMAELKAEAERYANFRFADWTAAPFGALATPDMVPVFLELLASLSRKESDIALLNCALDALRYGPPLTELAKPDDLLRLNASLDAVARDATFPSTTRRAVLDILLRDLPRNAARLISFARDVHSGAVEDEDDQLLGDLLTKLFPTSIRPSEVFDYRHAPRQKDFFGAYDTFWRHRLSKSVPLELLPEILDQLVQRSAVLRASFGGYQAARMAGDLLARALDAHGDAIDNARLYDWLGTGLDEYSHPRLDSEHQKCIAAWLAKRPERFRAVFRIGVERCVGSKDIELCLYGSSCRLYGAEPTVDIVPWYLEQAVVEQHIAVRQHFFKRAVTQLIRQGGQECLTLEALELLERWIAMYPEFSPYLEHFTSCSIEDWRTGDAARTREADRELKQRKASWRSHFRKYFDPIREGSAPPQILNELAQAYLGQHLDIKGETPSERLSDFLSGDEELVEAAYAGFRRSLDRDDLPDVGEIVGLEAQGRMHFIRQPCLVGIEELYVRDPENALHLDDEVLSKLLAFQLTSGGGREPNWFAALVNARPEMLAGVLVAYVLPLLRKGRDYLYGVSQLACDEDYAAVARAALPDLLKGFPLRATSKQLASVLAPLLKAALRYLDRAILTVIISTRLARGSMSAAQRVYWLACGLMLAPNEYEIALAQHVGASKALCGHLGAFLHNYERHAGFCADLPESSLALLITLLAPDSPPERPMGAHWVTSAMQAAEEVHRFVNLLGANPSIAAQEELGRLQTLPQLAPWQNRLRHAAHTQRIARRKAEFRPSDITEVCRTLCNREPANAADLAALTCDALHDLALKIRDGSTNDYRQYWDYDENHKPVRPRFENDCRDILLSDLGERLGRVGVEANQEGTYADDKRADIRVSFGGAVGFNVPIEIKKDSHADLWRAMQEQLIARYTRDPGAAGFGIYLVFWFGGKEMPLPQEGKRPRSAAELEERLRQTLSDQASRSVSVCVIDCALR